MRKERGSWSAQARINHMKTRRSKAYRDKQRDDMLGKQNALGVVRDPAANAARSLAQTEKWATDKKFRKRVSKSHARNWKNKEYKARWLKAYQQGIKEWRAERAFIAAHRSKAMRAAL